MEITKGMYFYEGDYVDSGHRNYFHHYKGIASSNFLVIREGPQRLVDSGMAEGPHRERQARELAADGVCLDETKAIYFSHSHPDHVTMAKSISSRSRDVEFFIHERNEECIRDDNFQFETFFNFPSYARRQILVWPDWAIKLLLRGIGQGFEYLRVEDFFGDWEKLDTGLESVAVPLPSHCPGHVGFYFPKPRVLYSADLFDSRCADGASLVAANSSYGKSVDDLNRLLDMDIDILLPGHGRPVFGRKAVKERLEEVKRGTLGYLARIMAVLKEADARYLDLSAVTAAAFPGSITYNAFSRRIITYNCLDHMRKLGMIDFSIHKGRARWYAL